MTQKIARAVARRGGTAGDVDSIVRGQFLTQGSRDEEPLLNHVAGLLTGAGLRKRRPEVRRSALDGGPQMGADDLAHADPSFHDLTHDLPVL